MLALLLVGLAAGGLGAQRTGAPAVSPDPPSPAEVLGYELGKRFTEVSGVLRYLSILDAASDRAVVREYGRTPGGRPLLQLVLSTPGTLDSLGPILERNRELTDPSTDPKRAGEIARSNPAVVYLSYGIHGDEAATSEAALWTAWDLARDAPGVSGVLDSLVVVIDPLANPDGRSRYLEWFREVRGPVPDPDPDAPEHREPWPGGRYNGNLFDLNRDWAWMTQPETRARLATWKTWNPQVHVDFHEMVETSTYFFFPPSTPINPIYPPHVLEWGKRFGAANARAFERRGWPYFTRSEYDLFYPGYGDSWPSLLGAVGMTYEQAGGSGAGLVVERPDGTLLTLEGRARHHRVAGHATLRAASRGRRALLEGFARTHRTVDEGIPDILLVPRDGRGDGRGDRREGGGRGPGGEMRALVRLLRGQGVRVERADEAFETDATPHPGFLPRERFPRGTLRVPARQPRGRLGSVLLRADNPLSGGMSYDITAWSLAYAYGVEAHSTGETPAVAWTPVAPDEGDREGRAGSGGPGEGGAGSRGVPEAGGTEGSNAAGEAVAGYLLRPEFASTPGLVDVLEEGGEAWAIREALTVGGHAFPTGAIFVGGRADSTVGRVLSGAGVQIDPRDDDPFDPVPAAISVNMGEAEGISALLDGAALPLGLPRIALLGGAGTDATAFGAHRYFLERTLGAPFDVVRVPEVSREALRSYDLILAPTGSGLEEALGPGGLSALNGWVREGGVVVASADAARSLAGPVGGVGPPPDGTRSMGRPAPQGRRSGGEGDASKEARGSVDSRAPMEKRDRDRWREPVRGAVLSVALSSSHPLAFGASAAGATHRTFVLSSGHAFDRLPEGQIVARFPETVNRVSGWVAEERLRDLSGGAWLVDRPVGRGRLVLFADDPLFRHFWYAGFQLVTNAILFAGAR